MTGAIFTQAAISDIDEIWDYTFETWGVDQAERYTLEIRTICHDLALGQKLGRQVKERSGYFRYTVGRHLIFFKERDEGILVMRVLHQNMDVERHLF